VRSDLHDEDMIKDKSWFTGQFLLALPSIGDPRFEQSVIVIASHDEGGAMGIGVNKVLRGMTVADVLSQLKIPHDDKMDMPVYKGGPMEPTRGFVLHSLDWGGKDAVQVSDRWMLSSSHDILRAIAEGRGPSRWLLALGYAGWGEGQLEAEMVQHGWHLTEGSDELLFDTEPDRKWVRAYADSGVDVRMLGPVGGAA
jgi:putative transcriptional regulator